MRDKKLLPVILLALVGFAASCDKGTPVAPRGAVLSLTASPTQIGLLGTSQVKVVAQRANGVPVNPGTEIRLHTTLGELPQIVTTDSRGVAHAELRAGDRAGTARISASSGVAEAAVVEVQIGFRPGTLILEANPQSVGLGGGTVSLSARVLDDGGAALSGASVVFSAPRGSFSANPVTTDGQGRAVTQLSLSANDVLGNEVEVTAQATAAGASASGNVRIQVRRPPQASFSFATSGLQVIFTDTSTGNPTSWHWTFGDGASRSTQNPVHTYAAPGTYTVTLVVSNPEGSDSEARFVTVSP
jgi:hypothetical protein